MKDGITEVALASLGKGFDLTFDFRLKYCKGKRRLVLLNETEKRDLQLPGFRPLRDVSVDIKCDKGDRVRHQSDILDFNQMSEIFNQKSSVPGKIPSGLFNAMFGFQSGSWARDAANTKFLALDGYFISLFSLHIHRSPLILSEHVRNAVPSTWDPRALARFIDKYGTHIVVGLSVGGQDVLLVRQDKSSTMEPSQLKQHVDELGDQLFTGSCTFSPIHSKSKEHNKNKAPEAFNLFDLQPLPFNSFPSVSAKDGITVISTKRGGEAFAESHCEWLLTVPSAPDAIQFSFLPITSLLKGVPGRGFLSHAINLYLRYKPPISDLQYFLEFQVHKPWAPIHSDLPLGPTGNMAVTSPALYFNFMGPKLYINTRKVTVGQRPVTGMRLYLEGMKYNRLAIHLQHLSNTPVMFQNLIDDTPIWRGSEEAINDRFLKPIHWKKFSHICTAPVKYDPSWTTRTDVSFIVTGVQLHVKKHNSKTVLHLRLLFSKVRNSFIAQKTWTQGASDGSQKSGFLSAISTSLITGSIVEKEKQVMVDSSVYPDGPPVLLQKPKLLKFVDMSQICKGPQDSPGHWLVTGAMLQLEKGKIRLHVKFSLLNIFSADRPSTQD